MGIPISMPPASPQRHQHPPLRREAGVRGRFKPIVSYDTDATESEVSDEELLARYDGWLITVSHRFQTTYKASPEDGEDASQDARLKLLRVKQEFRNHDHYCKVALTRSLCTSYAKYRKVTDALQSIDPEWDAANPRRP
jgi:hypothetical protein